MRLSVLAQVAAISPVLLWALAARTCVGQTPPSDAPSDRAATRQQATHSSPAINPPIPREQEERFQREWRAANKPLDEARKRADALMTAGNLAAAEWECVAALEYARTTPLAMPALIRPLLGEVYLREGRNRDALAIFLSLYPNYSGNTPTELNIAIAYARLGDYRNALKFYKEAQQRDPHLWEYRAGGRDARAQDWPGTASLNAIQASAFLARAVGRNGWYDEELCDLQTAERLAPHNALIAYLAGQVLHSMHRLQEAQAYFHRAAREGSGPVAADAGKQANAVQWWMDYQRSQPTLKPGG